MTKKKPAEKSKNSTIAPGIDLECPPPYWNDALYAKGVSALEASLGSEKTDAFLAMIGVHATFSILRKALPDENFAPQIFTLKVTLSHSKPAIWRRLCVWSEVTLGEMHEILQIAFGWTNTHLHLFRTKREMFAALYDDDVDANIEGAEDEDTISLYEVLEKHGDKLTYLYDMGDGWDHQITLEKVENIPLGDSKPPLPECVAGANACPPEDVGGICGYYEGLKILSKPSHESFDSYRDMFPENFDPLGFNREETNELLRAYWSNLEEREFGVGFEND
ncbi:MAG: plasmid pRiA4b ORF-3 family protein [Candidatus Sumerlaeaceae bacterium]